MLTLYLLTYSWSGYENSRGYDYWKSVNQGSRCNESGEEVTLFSSTSNINCLIGYTLHHNAADTKLGFGIYSQIGVNAFPTVSYHLDDN